MLQTSICIELYVQLKRTAAAQRPTQTKGRENERINLKEANYVYRSRTPVGDILRL